MAKTVAKRVSVDAQELWNAFKGDAAWRASYDKFRAKGLSFTRAVEEASRKSTGGSPATKTASGKTRRIKRTGAKPKPPIVGGGIGGVTPEEEAESRRYGRGQGKVKRESKMGKATAKGDNSRIGQLAIKRAWAKARASAGDAKWATMTKEQKVNATLRRVGPMTGEEAIGAVRALGSRVLTLSGSNDEVTKIINDWATGQGVKSPKTELKIGAKGKAEGKTGKQTARAGGKGAEAPAGPEKPKPEPGMGKKARRIIRRRNRLDEILRKGETEDQTRRELAQKPTEDAGVVPGESEDERKSRLGKVREEDLAFKEKYMVKIENKDGTTKWVKKDLPLPKGVKRRVVQLEYVKQSVPGKDKLGDPIMIDTLGKRDYNIFMKGNNVYVPNRNNTKWRIISLETYQEELLGRADPLTAEERKSDKAKRVEGRTKPVKSEFPTKMERVSSAGKALNSEYIVESASQAFIDANRKISEKNKIALGKGVSRDDLAPRYRVADFVDAAYPNLGKAERSQLISGIRRKFRGERKVRKTERAKKTGGVTVLRPETVEEGLARLTAKERRIAKRRAEPLEKVKLESKAEKRRRARRVKTVGQTLSAVMDPSKSTPSAEEMEPAPKAAKRKFVAPKPGSELEAEIAKLRESLSPTEKSTLRKIKETSRVGFTKDQVKKLAATGTLGKVTPKVRKIAKAGGYLGIVATALQFLEEPKQRKK